MAWRRPRFAAHAQAGRVQGGQGAWVSQNGLGDGNRPRQVGVGGVPDGRAGNDLVPGAAEACVETNPHEAMIQPDRPAMVRRHARKLPPGQIQPARNECGPAASSGVPVNSAVVQVPGAAHFAGLDGQIRREWWLYDDVPILTQIIVAHG